MISKKDIHKLLAVTVLALLASSVCAGTITLFDPTPLISTTGCIAPGCAVTSISNDAKAAQTFTAPVGGMLLDIRLFGGNFFGGSVPLEVGIYKTVSGLPSDSTTDMLGSVLLPLNQLPDEYPGNWFTVNFSSENIILSADDIYGVVLSKATYDGTSVAWWGSAYDPYSGGNFYSKIQWLGNTWREPFLSATGEHLDMALAVTISSVPEPTTILLLMSGLVVLFFRFGSRVSANS
jgi:hypothetical protein